MKTALLVIDIQKDYFPGGKMELVNPLEASQVFALGAFGVSAASAIGAALLIRARDILIGGLGLMIASHGFRK